MVSLPLLFIFAQLQSWDAQHGSQCWQSNPRLEGHLRWSMSGPLSRMSTLRLFFSVSSSAENMPAGPAPTMITSYFKGYCPLEPKVRYNNWHIFVSEGFFWKESDWSLFYVFVV